MYECGRQFSVNDANYIIISFRTSPPASVSSQLRPACYLRNKAQQIYKLLDAVFFTLNKVNVLLIIYQNKVFSELHFQPLNFPSL